MSWFSGLMIDRMNEEVKAERSRKMPKGVEPEVVQVARELAKALKGREKLQERLTLTDSYITELRERLQTLTQVAV